MPRGKAGDSRPAVEAGVACRLFWGIFFLTSWYLGGSARPLIAQGAKIEVLTNFEGGSVGKVEHVSATHLRCAVEGQSDQDHRNRQANWYYFELTNLSHAPVTVDLVDLAGEYNYKGPVYAVAEGVRPVYSFDNVHWQSLTDQQMTWDPQEPRLSLHFTPEGSQVWIAHVQPYTNKDVAALLGAFRTSPYLQVRSVGHTVEGREMLLLTITNPKVPDQGKKTIWLMFRQHAWETGSSWTCDGAVRFLLSDHERAARLRDRIIYKIFPMADPDGVARGGVRFNVNGYDLNRNWDMPNATTMPEIWGQRQAVLKWVDSGHHVDLFISLHNDETPEYIEGPAAFHALGERVFHTLATKTTFNPTARFRDSAETTTAGKAGRMNVGQGLFHDRHIPGMVMEQAIEFDSKLGRVPTASDRAKFGGEYVGALAEAVEANP
ncbi:MAG: M14-type cytosolic carboxypeptidase [Terriglobia bacterium]